MSDIESLFWQQIEEAWAAAGAKANAQRAALVGRNLRSVPATRLIDEALPGVIDRLRAAYDALPRETLAALDAVLERRLYDLDRAEIQAVTDGSDDGFLYARGFVVVLGRAFYDAVNADPRLAVLEAECEDMCYLPAHVHDERFGEWPASGEISRESCSNQAGWPEGTSLASPADEESDDDGSDGPISG